MIELERGTGSFRDVAFSTHLSPYRDKLGNLRLELQNDRVSIVESADCRLVAGAQEDFTVRTNKSTAVIVQKSNPS